jgi:hypothetical protein
MDFFSHETTALIAFFIALLFCSCLAHRQGTYLSPLDSQTIPYHTIPLQSDSMKSLFYGSLIYSTGTANESRLDALHWRISAD